MLEQDSVIPLYYQLKETLMDKIQKGDWKADDKIDSENQLMTQYQISRNTVKKAIEELVHDGMLYRIQGKGTFVAKPKLEQPLTRFYSFSKVMKEQGMHPHDIILDVREDVEVARNIRSALKLEKGDSVIVVKRVRCANDEPIMLEESYLPKKLVPSSKFFQQIGESSLYDLLEEHANIQVKKAKEAFEPILLKGEASRHLGVEKGSPALLLERTAFDVANIPVEFCQSIIRGDRCRFYTELL